MPTVIRFLPLFLMLSACQGPQAVTPAVPKDPTTSPKYRADETRLSEMAKEAAALLKAGKRDPAADVIVKGEELAARLLAVSKPTLAATQSASDLDQLYGDMLFSNKRYGWARIQYQKNLARWRFWQPQDDETARRIAETRKRIADCDKHLE